jgi:hypothetical protein
MSEDAQQMALFRLLDFAANRYPDLAFVFHTPNGGARAKTTAARLKRLGARAGVPDVLVPIRRGDYSGIAIEMKYGKNHATVFQQRYLEHLRRNGWLTYIEYDWTVAGARILSYIGASPSDYGLTAPPDCVIITTDS